MHGARLFWYLLAVFGAIVGTAGWFLWLAPGWSIGAIALLGTGVVDIGAALRGAWRSQRSESPYEPRGVATGAVLLTGLVVLGFAAFSA